MSVVLFVLSEQLPETPGFKTAVTDLSIIHRVQGKPASGCELAVFPSQPGKPLHLHEFTAGLLSSLGPLGTETLQGMKPQGLKQA